MTVNKMLLGHRHWLITSRQRVFTAGKLCFFIKSKHDFIRAGFHSAYAQWIKNKTAYSQVLAEGPGQLQLQLQLS